MNSSEEKTFEEKQEYLRKEILEKDYNPEDFSNFFANYTGSDEMDLEYYSFKELEEIVTNYQNQYKPGQITPKKSSTNITQLIVKDEENNKMLNSTKNIAVLNVHEIDEMIICNKIEKSPITGTNHFSIFIGEPQIIKGTLFSSSYVVYSITCVDIKTCVNRRFRDFDWLRTQLVNKFPGAFVYF